MRSTFCAAAFALFGLAGCVSTVTAGRDAGPKNVSEPVKAAGQAVEQGQAEAQLLRAKSADRRFMAATRAVGSGMSISHCLNGACPRGAAPSNDIVVREIYALSNNGDTKFADWVAYHPTRETIATSNALNRKWDKDPLLDESVTLEPSIRSFQDDYKGAYEKLNVQRGHLAPLTLFAGTEFWRTTNYYSNIVPQQAALNGGPWEALEDAEKTASFGLRELFVVTGPLYEIEMNCDPSIPESERKGCLPNADENHVVPSGFWKVVSNRTGSKKAAFIFPQTAGGRDSHCEYRTSIEEVELRASLTLFPGSDQASESSLYPDLGC
jgi:endonuclease G, mitochondrial